MPRHSSGTGNILPVPPLDIEEVKFWLHIMEDHALLIKLGLPFDKPDLIEEARAFEREFKALRARAEKSLSEKKFSELIVEAMASLKEFIRFKTLLLEMALTNKLNSALPPLFFDHVIREAEYFMAMLEKIRAGKKLSVVRALEADFWLRIMAEHTKFIGSRLDPSERSLIGVVRGYEAEFDDLSMQGWDYVSFFEHKSKELPAFNRFLQDSRVATIRLRDFKQAAYDMIIKNRMLSTIPAVLADHVRREADHFLLVLGMMEKGIIKIDNDCASVKYKHPKYSVLVDDQITDTLGDMEAVDYIEDDFKERDHSLEDVIDDIGLEYTPDNGRDESPSDVEYVDDKIETQEQPTDVTKAKYQVKAEVVPVIEDKAPAKPASAPKTEKKSKHKWGENWPRKLGKTK